MGEEREELNRERTSSPTYNHIEHRFLWLIENKCINVPFEIIYTFGRWFRPNNLRISSYIFQFAGNQTYLGITNATVRTLSVLNIKKCKVRELLFSGLLILPDSFFVFHKVILVNCIELNYTEKKVLQRFFAVVMVLYCTTTI